MGVPVVGVRDAAEALLPRRVPDLEGRGQGSAASRRAERAHGHGTTPQSSLSVSLLAAAQGLLCLHGTASRPQGGSEAGKRSGAKRSECLSSTSLLLSTSGRGDGGVRQRVLATRP